MDGLTQTQLGEQIGVRQQTIAAWEHGERPQSSYFGKLAHYLDMDEKELVALIDSHPPPPSGTVAGEAMEGSADLIMRQLAQSFMEADRKGRLSPQAAQAYKKLFEYFGRSE